VHQELDAAVGLALARLDTSPPSAGLTPTSPDDESGSEPAQSQGNFSKAAIFALSAQIEYR
jgi:hypothetical protein